MSDRAKVSLGSGAMGPHSVLVRRPQRADVKPINARSVRRWPRYRPVAMHMARRSLPAVSVPVDGIRGRRIRGQKRPELGRAPRLRCAMKDVGRLAWDGSTRENWKDPTVGCGSPQLSTIHHDRRQRNCGRDPRDRMPLILRARGTMHSAGLKNDMIRVT